MNMLQTGLKHRDGSELLEVSLPKLFVPNLCHMITTQTVGLSSKVHAGTCDWLPTALCGMQYLQVEPLWAGQAVLLTRASLV